MGGHGPSRKGSAELRKTSSWISCPYGKSGESILLADESGTPFASAVVVGVRIQRLQSLSEADARAEGTLALYHSSSLLPGVPLQTAFALNWCERYGTHAWAANPWVCSGIPPPAGRAAGRLSGLPAPAVATAPQMVTACNSPAGISGIPPHFSRFQLRVYQGEK